MSISNLRLNIESHLSTNFTTYPIKYENVAFETPTNSPWVACHIKRNKLPTPELNQASYEVNGILIFQVFTPLNSGTVTSNAILDQLAGLYNDQIISNIWFHDADITDVGNGETWYQVNLSIPFIHLGV